MASIRLLRERDDRRHFTCGNSRLDRYFRDYAWLNHGVYRISKTYVAIEGENIVGFVTVTPGEIAVDSVPRARRVAGTPLVYPLPVLRLARMGVRISHQRKGLGSALLRHGFGLAIQMESALGCVGVLVDAKPESVAFYQHVGFEPLESREGGLRESPAPVPMFLDTATIKAALGGTA